MNDFERFCFVNDVDFELSLTHESLSVVDSAKSWRFWLLLDGILELSYSWEFNIHSFVTICYFLHLYLLI